MQSVTVCYMSRPVRLPDYLADEVERLAAEEKRSLANMVAVLLEQALRGAAVSAPVAYREDVDDHFKPDPKRR